MPIHFIFYDHGSPHKLRPIACTRRDFITEFLQVFGENAVLYEINAAWRDVGLVP